MVHYIELGVENYMANKKCPACGATDTIEILYGMPTHEAFEASNNDIYP